MFVSNCALFVIWDACTCPTDSWQGSLILSISIAAQYSRIPVTSVMELNFTEGAQRDWTGLRVSL